MIRALWARLTGSRLTDAQRKEVASIVTRQVRETALRERALRQLQIDLIGKPTFDDDAFVAAARELIEISRQINGSTDFSVFDQVQAATKAATADVKSDPVRQSCFSEAAAVAQPTTIQSAVEQLVAFANSPEIAALAEAEAARKSDATARAVTDLADAFRQLSRRLTESSAAPLPERSAPIVPGGSADV